MPRTQGSVAIQSCKRKVRINEPFKPENLYGERSPTHYELYASYSTKVTMDQLDPLIETLNDSNTACKIIGNQLHTFVPARYWFERATSGDTHDVFILTRDREEQAFSWLLASKFGWHKNDEIGKEKKEFEVTNYELHILSRVMDEFLRWVPERGTLIDFENLPESHFDKTQIRLQHQHSLNNLKYITNYKYCKEIITDIINCYEYEWDLKINSKR
jgi:hypothetical protein